MKTGEIVELPQGLRNRYTWAERLIALPEGKAISFECESAQVCNNLQTAARYANRELHKRSLKVTASRVPNGTGFTLYLWTIKV